MPDNRNRKRPIQVKFFVDEKELADIFSRVGTAVHCLPTPSIGLQANWILQKSQSVATPAVLAILQVQQVASMAIFSSGAPLDLLAIRPFHNSKRHFPNGNRRQTPPCLPKSETDGRKSMAAQPFTLTIDGVRLFCCLKKHSC